MNLSTKTAVFKRVSFLIGGPSMSIGGPRPTWLRLCQDPCFCPGWIGGAMAPVLPLASPMGLGA